MGDSFSSLISSFPSIVIILPASPNFDQTAAGLGMYLTLGKKKEVSIACHTPMTVEVNRLVGVDKVSDKPGSKNMVIRFVGYDGKNIEKVSANIVDGEFELKIVPVASATPPKSEHVSVSFNGLGESLIVLIGGEGEGHFPILSTPEIADMKKVHIGISDIEVSSHHGVLSFAQPASSVSELTANLLYQAGLEPDMDAATNLLMGIEEATDRFMTESVSADTFEIIARLMRVGGRRFPKDMPHRDLFPPGSIPGEAVTTPEEAEAKEVPKSWFDPKIYTGTSIS